VEAAVSTSVDTAPRAHNIRRPQTVETAEMAETVEMVGMVGMAGMADTTPQVDNDDNSSCEYPPLQMRF
jgi:hypothetical protein